MRVEEIPFRLLGGFAPFVFQNPCQCLVMDKETVERGWCIAFESRHDVELERFAFRDGREDVSPGYLYPVVGKQVHHIDGMGRR